VSRGCAGHRTPTAGVGTAAGPDLAERLLGRKGDFRAVPALEAALRSEPDRGVAEDIRLALAELQRRIGDR